MSLMEKHAANEGSALISKVNKSIFNISLIKFMKLTNNEELLHLMFWHAEFIYGGRGYIQANEKESQMNE